MESISWPISICLKYLMAPTETLRPAPRPSYLMYGPLKAYGFERDSLSFMASYRSDTEQQVCIKNSFIYWQKLITGVSLGSTLQPFCLKFLSLIFLFLCQVLAWVIALMTALFILLVLTWKKSKISCVLILMQLRGGFKKITWLVMPRNVI